MPEKTLDEPKRVEVTERVVACGGPQESHPRVHLKIKDHDITCPYCGCVFVLKASQTE